MTTFAQAELDDIAQLLLDKTDTGSGTAQLIFTKSDDTVLAEINLQNPSFSRSANVLTLLGVTLSDASANATGTVAKAKVYDRNGALRRTHTVTAQFGGGEIEVNNTSFAAGEQIDLDEVVITIGN